MLFISGFALVDHSRLEGLESKAESLGQSLAEFKQVETVREEGQRERFNAVDKSLKEVSRGIQLVRDKQVHSTCKDCTTPVYCIDLTTASGCHSEATALVLRPRLSGTRMYFVLEADLHLWLCAGDS